MLSICNAAFDTLYAGVGTAATYFAHSIDPRVDELVVGDIKLVWYVAVLSAQGSRQHTR